jgi:hypothetical protein
VKAVLGRDGKRLDAHWCNSRFPRPIWTALELCGGTPASAQRYPAIFRATELRGAAGRARTTQTPTQGVNQT